MSKKKHNKTFRFFFFYSILIALVIFLTVGCGFQLNRNRIQLPYNARSISIDKIDNKSFIPRLDLNLRDLLTEKFAENSITLTTSNAADLILSFQIDALTMTKDDYSKDDDSQTYEFTFSGKGKLTVLNNNNRMFFLNNEVVSTSYSIKTTKEDLSSLEIESGRYETLVNLSNLVVTKLTQNF